MTGFHIPAQLMRLHSPGNGPRVMLVLTCRGYVSPNCFASGAARSRQLEQQFGWANLKIHVLEDGSNSGSGVISPAGRSSRMRSGVGAVSQPSGDGERSDLRRASTTDGRRTPIAVWVIACKSDR